MADRSPSADAPADVQAARERMVDMQLAARGIRHVAVLEAMRRVPRERFVPAPFDRHAYEDSPLPIGEGQTISQPYIVARMLEALDPRPDDRVLEIGGGSGYAAAVLGRVVAEVYTIERLPGLCERGRQALAACGIANVTVICGDGTLGWPDAAPYDGIVAAAAGPDVPATLREQLAEGGRLVMPVGPDPHRQQLVRVVRRGDDFDTHWLDPVRFVPLIGEHGWREGA